jgi:hypothetical protein
MSEFDPVRALREEIAGLVDVHKVVQARARQSEATMAEAEAEHNACLKMDAFLKGMVDQMQQRLNRMEREAEAKAKT